MGKESLTLILISGFKNPARFSKDIYLMDWSKGLGGGDIGVEVLLLMDGSRGGLVGEIFKSFRGLSRKWLITSREFEPNEKMWPSEERKSRMPRESTVDKS